MNVLVQLPLSDALKARLEAAAPGATFTYAKPREITAALVRGADVIVGNVSPGLLAKAWAGEDAESSAEKDAASAEASRLRLLQLNSAGYDKYVAPGIVPAGAALCSASGAYGQAVSEHVFASVLGMMKKLPGYRDLQRVREWGDLGQVSTPVGAHVLVLGAGDIGTHLASLFAAVGAHVAGVRSRPCEPRPSFERMGTLEDLDELLPWADVVASVLPSTPATRGLADEGFFARMRPGAYFANAGRGDLVVEDALVAALESGRLAGAALDVTSPEPLPADSPLWDAPGCVVTPHISGFFHLPQTLDNIVGIAAENLARLVAGEELRNRVDL